MKENSSIAINASRRCLKAGYAAGFVITGTEKIRCGFGNGDCLLFDFRHDTFAVADGSERQPRGSRKLLERFAGELASGEGTPTVEELQQCVSNIYQDQQYNCKTTFSCVSFIRDRDEVHAAVANGGDSLVMILDRNEGKRRFKTAADMNFAGRSISTATVNLIKINVESDLIVLATDGFADYIRQVFGAESPDTFDLFYNEPVDVVIDILTDSFEGLPDKIEYDDIGLLLIEPGRRNPACSLTVLTGGTSSSEENRFSGPEALEVPDLWLAESEWAKHREIITRAGIEISFIDDNGSSVTMNSG